MRKHYLALAAVLVAGIVLLSTRSFGLIQPQFESGDYASMEEQMKWSESRKCRTVKGEDGKDKLDCEGTGESEAKRSLRFWKERDPFKEPYAARSLEEVLLEMSDYAGSPQRGDWKRRKYLAEFAAKIIARDKDQPWVLKPELVNKALDAQVPGVQPYFLYWSSGFEKAPHAVVQHLQWITKASIKTMNETFQWSNLHLTLLDDKNLADYIKLPQHLIEKRSNYSTTYFSDLLRLELLCNYGGFWADSTFLFDKPMPREVYEADFFAFKLWQAPAYSSSWFLHSYRKHNPLLLWMRHIMFEYWHTHTSHEYFDLHKFMEIVIQFFPEIRPYYDSMPFYSSARAHAIHRMFEGTFNPEKYEAAKAVSWGYKLSYKAKINILPQLQAQADVARDMLKRK